MAIVRLAVQQTVPYSTMVHWDGWFGDLTANIKAHLEHDLGVSLVHELVNQPTPVTLKITMSEFPDHESYYHIYRMIAEFQPVEMISGVPLRMYQPAPLSWSPPAPVSTIDEAIRRPAPVEWQCDHCGQVNMISVHLECRRCGAPRRVLR